MSVSRQVRIAVIGAGASGIMAVAKLREMGQLDVHVFERAGEIGGTWRDNIYPGIACDVPSHLYRFSFAPNPEWSRVFSPGREILAYLKQVCEDRQVGTHVTFDAEVLRAQWDGSGWMLDTHAGTFGPFEVLITAMGILRHPIYPDIPGRSSFTGIALHSQHWKMDTQVEGRRVGVIGNGSTATQLACAIVDDVAKLTMFQRTPQWIIPMTNGVIAEEEKESFRRFPHLLQERYAQLSMDFNSKFGAATVGENPKVYNIMVNLCEQYLNTVVDPVLREKLRPSYKVGCKRLVMSDRFYEAIQRPNAELVTEGIASIEPAGVRTVDGHLHGLDVLVYATGYDAHSPFSPMEVVGAGGRTIAKAWEMANQAYMGVAIPGFPNLFMIGGPNSPIGNFSFLMTAENQCGYALRMVETLAAGPTVALAPTTEATLQFNEAVKARMPSTVWATGCRNWYMDKHGNVALWPWNWEHFENAMRAPNLAHFESVDATVA